MHFDLPNLRQDLLLRRELLLPIRHEEIPHDPLSIDQKHRRPGDVPGVQSGAMPDTVPFRRFAMFIDQDVEGKPRLLDVVLHVGGALCHDGDDLDVQLLVLRERGGELAEPAAAVRSPGAPVKHQQHRPRRQMIGKRPRVALLRGKRELRRPITDLQRVRFVTHLKPTNPKSRTPNPDGVRTV